MVLAWASTVHKFQGFKAGFEETDQVRHIIANLNNLEWEKNHIGTAYVVTSRAKTIGHASDPSKSNLFFDGQIGKPRFTDILKKENGDLCLLVEKRETWTKYLDERYKLTKARYNNNELRTMKRSMNSAIKNPFGENPNQLDKQIINIINHPNDVWALLRGNYNIT